MIAVGVDTHKGSHFAVALDRLGQLLGELVIEVSAAGYRELERWAAGLAADGQQLVFGIEGTGSWGAGLCEHLQRAGCSVVEVERIRNGERRGVAADHRKPAHRANQGNCSLKRLNSPRANSPKGNGYRQSEVASRWSVP